MGIAIVVVLVLVVGGAVAFLVTRNSGAAKDSVREDRQSAVSRAGPRPAAEIPDGVPIARPAALPRLSTPESPAPAEPTRAVSPSADSGNGGGFGSDAGVDEALAQENEAFDRFSAPGQRAKKVDAKLVQPMATWAEPVVAPAAKPEAAQVSEPEPVVESVLVSEPEPVVAAAVESVSEPVEMQVSEPVVESAVEPEAESSRRVDPVDHILNALINRARERQVAVAQVAAELVEQADLEDREVDEVLADLVGLTADNDDEPVSASERLSELTLFSSEVPRRPGQLTDFANLSKAERKRALIRVLCLLVALQEDHKLKPRQPASEAETRSWPLARAIWPVKPQTDGEDSPGSTPVLSRAVRRR
ncbi:MAG: hypothetical protein N2037_12820 [Acidimicrobiales bacterium]|nr:hypothetical protein [Acidimicrobiales bacterium]